MAILVSFTRTNFPILRPNLFTLIPEEAAEQPLMHDRGMHNLQTSLASSFEHGNSVFNWRSSRRRSLRARILLVTGLDREGLADDLREEKS
ncbi:hypothetical protein AVEN_268738-1 [Araneus ventricosus]|uniref:Uncharacterized protein n=1 Tax=Araneus ventricosus TaxID=182803 RepID=A0A4Y2H278_ARAVE|nr:hypothetical protein AVEN_268738-1 [Araneus ventricosus]